MIGAKSFVSHGIMPLILSEHGRHHVGDILKKQNYQTLQMKCPLRNAAQVARVFSEWLNWV